MWYMTATNMYRDMEPELLLYWESVNWYHHFVKTILTLSSAIKDVHTSWFSNSTTRYLSLRVSYTSQAPRSTPQNVQTNIVRNSEEILEKNPMHINSKMDKLWYICTKEYYIAMTITKLVWHTLTWVDLRNYVKWRKKIVKKRYTLIPLKWS